MSAPAKTTNAAPEPLASDLIGSGVEGGLMDQVQAWWQRVRSGDMGALPAIGGLIVLSLLFASLSPYFLTERNFANLLNQGAASLEAAIELENRAIYMSQSTQDSAERRKAFVEKRKPAFTGR